MVKFASAAQELPHTPVGRRGACSGEHSWWSSVSQSICISKTGLSEGFGELGLTAKAMML